MPVASMTDLPAALSGHHGQPRGRAQGGRSWRSLEGAGGCGGQARASCVPGTLPRVPRPSPCPPAPPAAPTSSPGCPQAACGRWRREDGTGAAEKTAGRGLSCVAGVGVLAVSGVCSPEAQSPGPGAETTVGSQDDWRGVRRGELPAHREKTPSSAPSPTPKPQPPASPGFRVVGHVLRADRPAPPLCQGGGACWASRRVGVGPEGGARAEPVRPPQPLVWTREGLLVQGCTHRWASSASLTDGETEAGSGRVSQVPEGLVGAPRSYPAPPWGLLRGPD